MASNPDRQHDHTQHIALVGAGTIGLSFAALHLTANPSARLAVYDTRPDLEDYIASHLPGYISSCAHGSGAAPSNGGNDSTTENHLSRLRIATSLSDAVSNADFIQEQGPETASFKQSLWPQIERHALATAIFWSSTSGIPASTQAASMSDPSRLTVLHPYNPPHMMPLLELVPSPATSQTTLDRTNAYWRKLGRAPALVRKETPGFVANRLAFALLREAFTLVADGVISVSDLDQVVTQSMGPRWAVAGPFQSYHAGGGEGGLEAFMRKIGGTVQECWSAGDEARGRLGGLDVGGEGDGGEWLKRVCGECEASYGIVDTRGRDERLQGVLDAAKERRQKER